jgi:hypothetical protein
MNTTERDWTEIRNRSAAHRPADTWVDVLEAAGWRPRLRSGRPMPHDLVPPLPTSPATVLRLLRPADCDGGRGRWELIIDDEVVGRGDPDQVLQHGATSARREADLLLRRADELDTLHRGTVEGANKLLRARVSELEAREAVTRAELVDRTDRDAAARAMIASLVGESWGGPLDTWEKIRDAIQVAVATSEPTPPPAPSPAAAREWDPQGIPLHVRPQGDLLVWSRPGDPETVADWQLYRTAPADVATDLTLVLWAARATKAAGRPYRVGVEQALVRHAAHGAADTEPRDLMWARLDVA